MKPDLANGVYYIFRSVPGLVWEGDYLSVDHEMESPYSIVRDIDRQQLAMIRAVLGENLQPTAPRRTLTLVT